MSNPEYLYWQRKLAGEDPDPLEPRDTVPSGFWRLNDGKPLATWRDRGVIWGMIGFDQRHMGGATLGAMAESGAFKTAVPEDDYRAAIDSGRWSDTDAVVAAQTGHNRVDAVEALADQIEAATAGVSEYEAIADDEQAARAQSLRSRLNELAGEVAKIHKREKEPHLDAGRVVDRKWFPLRDKAKEAADKIRDALSRFETAKARQEADERRRREAEAMASANKTAPVPQPDPVPAPSAPTKIKGGYGRPANVRPIIVAVVVDQDAVYATLRNNTEVKAVLQKIAQKLVNAGETVPGVEVREERKVV